MKNIEGTIIIDYADIKNTTVGDIANITSHTANTWQANRGATEKYADATIGKIGESAVIKALKSLNIKNYHFYDSFRNDNFKRHAPFDGVFAENLSSEVIALINSKVAAEGSKLSADTRNKLRENNVLTVEVKSTRLAQQYKERAEFKSYSNEFETKNLIRSLKRYDFITYPHFIREGTMTFSQYCTFVENRLNTGKTGAALEEHVRQIELENATDIYMRVFVDEENKKALIMGWIDRIKLLTPPEIKKLPSPKSKDALYLAKLIARGESIMTLGDF